MVQSLAEGSVWCLRFENAHHYLQEGDIHFFLDTKGNAQIAINVKPDGEIYEMQRRYKQDGAVPVAYAEIISDYATENRFSGRKQQIKHALEAKPKFDELKARLHKMQEEGNFKGIFKEIGIDTEENADGTLTISRYSPFIKGKNYTLFDLGINENLLFQNVSSIVGKSNFNGSALTSAPKIKKIGEIDFGDSKISDLRSLEEFKNTKVSWIKQ